MKSYLTIYSILFVVLRITPASSHPNPNALVAISKGTRAVKCTNKIVQFWWCRLIRNFIHRQTGSRIVNSKKRLMQVDLYNCRKMVVDVVFAVGIVLQLVIVNSTFNTVVIILQIWDYCLSLTQTV